MQSGSIKSVVLRYPYQPVNKLLSGVSLDCAKHAIHISLMGASLWREEVLGVEESLFCSKQVPYDFRYILFELAWATRLVWTGPKIFQSEPADLLILVLVGAGLRALAHGIALG